MIPTVIIRHARERLSKCSLEPLRGQHPGLTFLKAQGTFRFDATGFILLHVDAPPLSPEDASIHNDEEAQSLATRLQELALHTAGTPLTLRPLLLLDSTWLLLPKLERTLTGTPIRRSLPAGSRTAYPRVSKVSPDPSAGLASVEALYLAQRALGHDEPSLLAHYYWREAFLRQFTAPAEPAVFPA